MSKKTNEFAMVMKLATSPKYKDKPLVSLLVKKINMLKDSIIMTENKMSLSAGYINGLKGEDGYSPFVWNGNTLSNVQASVNLNVELRVLTELTMLLVEILNEHGASLII